MCLHVDASMLLTVDVTCQMVEFNPMFVQEASLRTIIIAVIGNHQLLTLHQCGLLMVQRLLLVSQLLLLLVQICMMFNTLQEWPGHIVQSLLHSLLTDRKHLLVDLWRRTSASASRRYRRRSRR